MENKVTFKKRDFNGNIPEILLAGCSSLAFFYRSSCVRIKFLRNKDNFNQ